MILHTLLRHQEVTIILLSSYAILAGINIYTYIKERKRKKLPIDTVTLLFRLVPFNLIFNAWQKLASKKSKRHD